jgi:O-antigen ligase
LSTALLLPHLKARFLTISFEEQAIDLRFFYNKMALSIIKEKPFLGIGIGNFVWYSQNYQVFLRAANKMLSLVGQSDKEIPKWLFQPVHNIYLLIAVEMGLLGLVAFLLFLGRILLGWLKVCFLPARHRLRHQVLVGGFLVSCFLILGLTDHYFWTLQQGGLMFWLSLALLDQ